MIVTAVMAHPDDELMCAGTLARFAAEGHHVNIYWLFDSEEGAATRFGEALASADVLGAAPMLLTDRHEDDYRVDRDAVDEADLWASSDIVISHRPDDTNQSHSKLAQVMRAACRKNRCTLWQMDQSIPGGWDSTSPRPNHLVNITATWSKKMDAVLCYKSQLERYPRWWTAIETRDRHYGWMLDQGNNDVTHAEGFIVEKSVWL